MENTLHQALIDIENSVTLLISPRVDVIPTHTGEPRTITKASLYTELTESIDARPHSPGESGSFSPVSKPPLWIPALDWVHTVDKTVRKWTPKAQGDTYSRLNWIIDNTWRPQDTEQLYGWSNTIKQWVVNGEELVEGRTSFDVVAACPQCETDIVWRPNLLGESVRKPALRVTSGKGCTCLNCGKHWPQQALGVLAAQLRAETRR